VGKQLRLCISNGIVLDTTELCQNNSNLVSESYWAVRYEMDRFADQMTSNDKNEKNFSKKYFFSVQLAGMPDSQCLHRTTEEEGSNCLCLVLFQAIKKWFLFDYKNGSLLASLNVAERKFGSTPLNLMKLPQPTLVLLNHPQFFINI
jgi:hypothetical protein